MIKHYIKTIFFYNLIFLSSYSSAFSYTLTVETSPYKDDVSIIGNVIGTEINTLSSDTISNNKNRRLIHDQNEKDQVSLNNKQKKCLNLVTRPFLDLSYQFKTKIKNKGISLESLNQAEHFWNINEARDTLDACNKINKDVLIKNATQLKGLLRTRNFRIMISSFPKIYFLNDDVSKNLTKTSKNLEDKYLKELFDEVLKLRKDLLKTSENEVILSHYYNHINQKSKSQQLNNEEKKFVADFYTFQINSKIDKLGLKKNSYFHNNDKFKKSEILFIDPEFYRDISPMIDIFFISSNPIALESYKKFDNTGSAPLIDQLSYLMNNL